MKVSITLERRAVSGNEVINSIGIASFHLAQLRLHRENQGIAPSDCEQPYRNEWGHRQRMGGFGFDVFLGAVVCPVSDWRR